MSKRIHEYKSDEITVSYDAARCIHAAECVRGLPGVFDPKRKPWIDADAAEAERIAEIITRCPSGALQYERKDGGVERPEETNSVRMDPNGPLYLRGNIAVLDGDGEVVVEDTRVALCRCGASANKPFCDMSHDKAAFKDAGVLGEGGVKQGKSTVEGGRLEVRPSHNGPYLLNGDFGLIGSDGEKRDGDIAALCRCGNSSNKPFCDGTHRKVGFEG